MSKNEPCPELIWFATNECNLDCLYCCNKKSEQSSDELSTQEAREFIRQVAEFSKYFVVIGGEPLLRKDLLELLYYAKTLGLSCSLITKGTLLNRKWAEALAQAKVRVNIALDSLVPEMCNRLSRKEGTYRRTKEAIDMCLQAGILQGITCTLFKTNARDTLDVLYYAAGLGVEGCWMSLRPVGRGGKIFHEFALTGLEYEKYMDAFYRRATEIRKKTGLQFYVYDPIYSRILSQHGEQSYKICGLGRYLNVDACGNIIACLYTDLKVGNIREKSLKEVWNDVSSNRFFHEIHDPENLKGACRECIYNSVCGGCRARTYQLTGDWFASDPVCYYA